MQTPVGLVLTPEHAGQNSDGSGYQQWGDCSRCGAGFALVPPAKSAEEARARIVAWYETHGPMGLSVGRRCVDSAGWNAP
jgi:hypothetical protein